MEKDQPYLWRFRPLLHSTTMRALLVGGVSWLLSALGVAQTVADADAARWVELGLQLIEGAAFAWAAWARYHRASPPLTLTKAQAAAKNTAFAPVSEGPTEEVQ